MIQPASKRTINTKWILTALAFVLVALILLIHQPRELVTNAISKHISSIKAHTPSVENPLKDTATIPNIVHFVHVYPSGPKVDFHHAFRHFIAVYSAYHYLKPETIYIHTNVEQHIIDEALNSNTNPITQAIANLPNVKFNHHNTSDVTSKGVQITTLQHQADFMRTDVLVRYGGIYLDNDAYVLRDLKPLRRMGFETVFGTQDGYNMCNAVMFSTPKNKVMKAFRALQDGIYDGGWSTIGGDLLTTLTKEFQEPHQCMIMAKEVFFPLDWMRNGITTIYQSHNETNEESTDDSPLLNHDTANLTDFLTHFTTAKPDTWKRDWRMSYTLHGWNHGIDAFTDAEKVALFGADESLEGGGISELLTLEYVMKQTSNFARAVYPAVKAAVDEGVLEHIRPERSRPEIGQKTASGGG
ncbi:hypothetical protein MMC21_007128 [Puttea exsequens]|nr:hypothetical protein [Puttea exsequens]